MKTLPWRWILPPVQIIGAAVLLVSGNLLRKNEAGLVDMVDYVPTTELLAHAINFPARVVSAPFGYATSDKLASTAIYLVAIGFFWFWMGWEIDRGFRVPPPRGSAGFGFHMVLLVAAAATSVLLAAASLLVILPRFPINGIAGMLWSTFFFFLFGSRLRTRCKADGSGTRVRL